MQAQNYWKPCGANLHVGTYMVGTNEINTLLVGIGDRQLVIVNPGQNLPASAFDELDKIGDVIALVSPGAFHHLGFPEWHKRFPEAGLYSTTSGVERIAKKQPGIPVLKSYAALKDIVGPDMHFHELPAKHQDIVMFFRSGDEITLMTNEVFTNNPSWPTNVIFKLLVKVMDSGPGLRVNNMTCKLIGAKPAAAASFISEKIKEHGVTRLVPCHGDIIDGPDTRGRIESALAAAA